MNPPNRPKLHHYVPQFLLREFAFGKKHQLHAYDKRTDRVFVTNVKNAASETSFYDFEAEGLVLTLEPAMGNVESGVAPILQRIVREESLASLSLDDRARLSLFVAVQLFRTRDFRDRVRQVHTALAERLRQMGVNLTHVPDYAEPTEDSLAALQSRMLLHAHEMAPFVAEKTWVLLKNQTGLPFYTSDNPVTFQNHRDRSRGSIGLGVPGIEICLPLSKRLTLSMLCRSYEEGMQTSTEWARRIRQAGLLPPSYGESATRLEDFLETVRRGAPIEQSPENVINVNSLQVKYAARYVYSSTNDFGLVREMLRSTPALRGGGSGISVE